MRASLDNGCVDSSPLLGHQFGEDFELLRTIAENLSQIQSVADAIAEFNTTVTEINAAIAARALQIELDTAEADIVALDEDVVELRTDLTEAQASLAEKATAAALTALQTSLEAALADKADDAEITALVEAIAGKAATVHTHTIAQVDGLQDALDALEAGSGGGSTSGAALLPVSGIATSFSVGGTDTEKAYRYTGAGGHICTILDTLAEGAIITVYHDGSGGSLSFSAGAGVVLVNIIAGTISTAAQANVFSIPQYSSCVIHKIAAGRITVAPSR